MSIPSLLCFDNLLEQGTVTVGNNTLGQANEDPQNPIENLFDWLATDFYKPNELGTINIDLTLSSPAPADYLAIYAHDLHTAPATLKLQYWNGSTWIDAAPALAPTTGAPLVVTFTEQTSDKWRLVLTALSEIPSIGVCAFGKAMRPVHGNYLGYSEPLMARAPELINSVSEGGAFLGRSVIHQGFRTNLVMQYETDAWVRAYWLGFVRHAEQKPFFYVWNLRDYPEEAAFCWADGEIAPPSHSQFGYMSASFSVRGHTE